ncbi:hypothetical protein CEXT_253981 [Caerostris extrusa]|uniref:Uncharacterized protein n=1 Tax=Caerostris extrusa TaxID=172846 RepID=A0AAV4XE27_CAEEX|nr:hypothetical protein CEXT_253981 [Caerostris extrusa]
MRSVPFFYSPRRLQKKVLELGFVVTIQNIYMGAFGFISLIEFRKLVPLVQKPNVLSRGRFGMDFQDER